MPSPTYSMKYILGNFKRNVLLPNFLYTDFIRRHTLNIAYEKYSCNHIFIMENVQKLIETPVSFSYFEWYALCTDVAHGQSLTQLCSTLCDPMDCKLPGSSPYGIFQARMLERVFFSYFRWPSWLRDGTCFLPCRQILYHSSTWEAHALMLPENNWIH